MELPPGITVIDTDEPEMKLASLGKYDFSYMISYECHEPGRFVLVSYECLVAPDFRGGEVTTLPGFLSDVRTFLGFTDCDYMEVPAAGGTATVRLQ
jgi:hypothetical protein